MKNKLAFLQFIKERFPIHILTFTTLSTVFASASITTNVFNYWQVIVAFVITTLFLFHIRAIDERRDFINDSEFHPERPIQQGIISIKKLLTFSVLGIILSLVLALFSSTSTFVISLIFLVFTTFAAFDFFIPTFFKNRPVLYHIINSPQMILLQWLIFSIFSSSFDMTFEMFLFMFLIYINIFILELVRKINSPDNDTSDTYSANLGLKKSIAFLIFLVFLSFIFYTIIIRATGTFPVFNFLFFGALLCLFVIAVFLYFYFKPRNSFKKKMELSAVILYVFMNLLIYLAK